MPPGLQHLRGRGPSSAKMPRPSSGWTIWKNFGFVDEVTVVAPGINGKMSEFTAALGLLQLQYIDGALSQRAQVDAHTARPYGFAVHSLPPGPWCGSAEPTMPPSGPGGAAVPAGARRPLPGLEGPWRPCKRRYFLPAGQRLPRCIANLPSAAAANLRWQRVRRSRSSACRSIRTCRPKTSSG